MYKRFNKKNQSKNFICMIFLCILRMFCCNFHFLSFFSSFHPYFRIFFTNNHTLPTTNTLSSSCLNIFLPKCTIFFYYAAAICWWLFRVFVFVWVLFICKVKLNRHTVSELNSKTDNLHFYLFCKHAVYYFINILSR